MDTEIPGSLLVALATAIGILVGEGAPASPPGCRGQAKLSLRGEVCRGGVILSSKSSLEVSSSNPVSEEDIDEVKYTILVLYTIK